MRIRTGIAGDLEAIVSLERGIPTAPHWGMQEYEAILERKAGAQVRRRLFVADESGIVGFGVGRVAGDEGEVESLAVAEGSRGRGTGMAVLQAVLDWCCLEGAKTVILEVRAGSEGPIRLYRRMGFVLVGRRPGYYRHPDEDAVLMQWIAGAGKDWNR